MNRARKCPRCGCITLHERCSCGKATEIIRDLHLRRKLSIDVTLTLRFDDGVLRPYLLVQKPSGQERIPLRSQDLLHV